jgi:hypothetical protein
MIIIVFIAEPFLEWNYSDIVSAAALGGINFKSCGGSFPCDALVDVRKLRQRSSGIAATAINASWLSINPTSQGNAFCIKP